MPADVKSICDRYSSMMSDRGTWERTWQEVRDLVRPNTSDFQFKDSPGQVRTYQIYDGTAPQALGELAAGLQSFLTNPAERWFEIGVDGIPRDALDNESLLWLEFVADAIFSDYNRQSSNFNASIAETYLDLGAFGTAVLYQEWDPERRGVLFRSIPLADCFIEESSKGLVDVLYRKIQMTLRQCIQEFGTLPPKYVNAQDADMRKVIEILHCVHPRKDYDYGKKNATNKPFASVWIHKEDQYLLREGGYDTFPYHVPRWTKICGEVYGRSPAITCLPDIKMLNRMEYTAIKQLQKAVDPPVLLPNDGFILPLQTAPGSVNYKEPGSENWEYMEFRGQWPIGLEITNQKRDFIRRCFAADWLRMEKEKIEMTAYEVADRRDEKLRFLAPMLGRLETELHSPTIERTYELKLSHGQIPPAPTALEGTRLKVGYVSPAAMAQLGSKAISMGRYIQELIPLAQLDPSVMDIIDMDMVASELATLRGTTRKVIRSQEDIEALREQRQQVAAMQQAAAIAEPASKAVKNLSEANAKGNML